MIRTYNVTGQSVDEFKDNLYAAVRRNNPLGLDVQLVLDELSVRRGEHADIQQEMYRIYAIHPDPYDFFVTVQHATTHLWGTLRIADETITLSIAS